MTLCVVAVIMQGQFALNCFLCIKWDRGVAMLFSGNLEHTTIVVKLLGVVGVISVP